MSKSNAFETELLNLLFVNDNIANLGDATGVRGSSTAGNLYLSLHTSDPGEGGSQSTNEIAYTGYARKAVARNGTNFTVSGNQVSLAADQDFGKMTAGAGGTVTHWGIGTDASGAGLLLYSGEVDPDIGVSAGTIPRIEAGTNITED